MRTTSMVWGDVKVKRTCSAECYRYHLRRHIESVASVPAPTQKMPSLIAACKFVGTTSLGLFTVSSDALPERQSQAIN